MNTLSLIAAATTIVAASAIPAAARTVAPPPIAPVTASTATPSPTQRVCVVDTYTGSRVPSKLCRTRAEWAKMGVDPFAK